MFIYTYSISYIILYIYVFAKNMVIFLLFHFLTFFNYILFCKYCNYKEASPVVKNLPAVGNCRRWGFHPWAISITEEQSGKLTVIFDLMTGMKVKVLVAQSCPTLRDPMDCSPSGLFVHGISQARILEWVAISFSRGYFWPRDQTCALHVDRKFSTLWATREALVNDTYGKQFI